MTTLSGKKLTASAFIAVAIKGLGAILSYAMIVAFARLLSAEDYGQFAFGLNAAIILATVVGLGFATGIMRYYPQYIVARDKARARGVVESGFIVTLLAGIILLAILFSATLLVPVLKTFGAPLFWVALGSFSIIIALSDYANNVLRAQGGTVISMLPRDVLWRLLSPLAAFFSVRLGLGLNGTISLAIAAAVLLLLTIWQSFHVSMNLERETGKAKGLRDFRSLLPSLLPLWAAGLIFAMIQQFDVIIVGSMLSKVEAGSYFAAQKTAQLLSLVLIAGGLATAPTMSALFHANKHEMLQVLCRKLALAIAAVTALGFLFLIFTGKQLLGFFDARFVEAYPILIVIAFGTVIDAISGPNAYLMQMTNFERDYLKILIGCYALVLTAQVLLIPRYGSMGAAMASAGGVVLWNILAISVLRRKAGLDPSMLSLIAPPRAKAHQ